jgi:hypothetical protein
MRVKVRYWGVREMKNTINIVDRKDIDFSFIKEIENTIKIKDTNVYIKLICVKQKEFINISDKKIGSRVV